MKEIEETMKDYFGGNEKPEQLEEEKLRNADSN